MKSNVTVAHTNFLQRFACFCLEHSNPSVLLLDSYNSDIYTSLGTADPELQKKNGTEDVAMGGSDGEVLVELTKIRRNPRLQLQQR